MVSEQRPDLPNRQTPFSEAFKEFIATDWAPYATTSPTVLPGAIAAASHRFSLPDGKGGFSSAVKER